MSSPEPGATPRPLRTAGLALLAVAVAATVAGLISLIIDDEDGSAAQPPSNTTATSPSTTTGEQSQPGGTPAPTTATSGTGAPGQPPATTTAAQPPAPPPVTAVPVRVYNNSTIRGLAARAADDFRRAGWRVDEVTNYPDGIIPTSTVYYRPGTNEEAAARVLGNRFDLRIQPRFAGIAQSTAGLIVIVTNDYGAK